MFNQINVLVSVLTSRCVFILLKGDENDPEQQSDSEEGSNKGEPQVTVKSSAFLSNTMAFILILALASHLTRPSEALVFSNLSVFPPLLCSFPLSPSGDCLVARATLKKSSLF